MKYKGIIFDLDGVLCSTDEYHYQAWQALAEKIGATGYSREDNARQRGISRLESLEVVLEKAPGTYTDGEKLAMAEWKNDTYRALLANMSADDLSDEVKTTLETLRAKGMLLAIGSSSKNTPFILERLGLADFFDAVSDGNNITRAKPDPEVFLTAAERLGLQPKDCLVIEDAFSGVEAGLAGGFDTAAIGYAALHEKPTYKLETFSDILKIMEGGYD